MDVSHEKPKLIKMLSQSKNEENRKKEKHKHAHKLNVSDFLLIKKKQLSKKYKELIDPNEKNNNINKPQFRRRSSFNYRLSIKHELLKDYREQMKIEKKHRILKITENLSDSMEEDSGEEEENKGLEIYISSESYFIFIFDIIILFFALYSLLFIPLNRAERKYYYVEEKPIYIIFNFITEILFILDLCISFFRTYYNFEYKRITDTNKIIINYLTTDFLMDLLEAIPSYIISRKYCYKNVYANIELTGFEITITIFQMLKTFKILKVLGNGSNRAIELLHEKIAETFILEKLFNIFLFLFKILSFMHVLICIHIFLGWQSYPNWMTHINIFGEDLITKYISSFYFIIETMTTVGYGDIICISPIERFFQLILLSIGIVSYSFIITKFGNYVMKQSKEEIELDKKIIQLEQIRIQYPLMPFKLYIKIHDYFKKKSEKNNSNNEMRNLVVNLPDKLRNDLLLVIYKDVIDNFIIFKGCKNTDFITQICAAFIQTICEKETVLIKEGAKVDNIIFVRDGRLILEATINVSNPTESYEKYFKENFNYINIKSYQKMRNSISQNNSNIDVNQLDSNNYLTHLEEKLMETNKIGKKGNSFFDATRNSISFQVEYESEKENQKSDISSQRVHYKYLKILDIRKNEHFGDVSLFLDKPAPLTLKVKSKIAKIFILKKKDALMINNIHHNIVDRIREKSFKNLMSIKRKTIQILKNFTNDKLNKLRRTQIQNTSWFNEKSRNNALNDITNFLNNSINLIEREDISPSINSPLNATKRRSSILDFWKIRTPKRAINNNKNNKDNSFHGMRTLNSNSSNYQLKKKYAGIRSSYQTEFHSVSSKNNLLSLNYEPKINKNNTKNKSFSLKTNLDDMRIKICNLDKNDKMHTNIKNIKRSSKKINTHDIKRVTLKFVNDKSQEKHETESLSKDLKNSSLETYSEISSQNTKEEEKITTINDIYTDGNSQVRKKIRNSVEKERILKLCKLQAKIIELYGNKINEQSQSKSKGSNTDNNDDISLKRINDLNNTIYNKILEYLDTEPDTDTEVVNRVNRSTNFPSEKVISFSIKSSYSNLNNLTKGKIIINNNYKIDIKNLIQNYIKEKNKNSTNSIDYFVKKYYKDYQEQEQMTFNNETPKKNKKVKFKVAQSSRNLNIYKENNISSQVLSHRQIKKTITNKKKSYKNFKNMGVDDKLFQIKLKNKNTNTNFSSKIFERGNNLEDSKSNSANGFTKFINSIFSKLKG